MESGSEVETKRINIESGNKKQSPADDGDKMDERKVYHVIFPRGIVLRVRTTCSFFLGTLFLLLSLKKKKQQSQMSAIARAAARVRQQSATPLQRPLLLQRKPILSHALPLHTSPLKPSLATSITSLGSQQTFQRRWASASAKADEGIEEEVWPERKLPELTETDKLKLRRQRNVGISAHIDSGKTTLTERVRVGAFLRVICSSN